jgi:hypothetical protein
MQQDATTINIFTVDYFCLAVYDVLQTNNGGIALLYLASNKIGDAGATRVAEFLMRTQSLKTLYLTGNHTIGLAGTAALGRALKCNVSLVEYQARV